MAHVHTAMSGWFHGAPEFGEHFDTNREYERQVSVAFTGTISLVPPFMLPCLVGRRGVRNNGARGNPPTVLHSFNSLSLVMFLYTGSSQTNFTSKCLINGARPWVSRRVEKQEWGMNVLLFRKIRATR